MTDLEAKTELLCRSIVEQFVSRTEIEGKKSNISFGIDIKVEIHDHYSCFTFSKL